MRRMLAVGVLLLAVLGFVALRATRPEPPMVEVRERVWPVAGAEAHVLDFMADGADQQVKDWLGGKADVVMSDMAAASSGHKQTDHLRIIPLGEAAAHAVGYFDVRYGMTGMERAGDAVLGGIGSIPGAVLGSLVLGWTESFAPGYISSDYEDVFAFGFLVLILIFRPAGLLGKTTTQKV